MITEQLIWFIDSRFYYQNISLDKIVLLANIHHKRIKIIIDASAQSTGRGYWHLFNDKEALSKELMATIDKKEKQLLKFFSMNAINVEVTINQSTNYLAKINDEVANNANSIIVIEDNIVAKRHPIFQHLNDINSPILLLNSRAWKHPINILAAIDPLHEYASTGRIDDSIISLMQSWSGALKAKWTIAHCYYVDSILTKYKNNVLTMHRDGLNSFEKKFRLSHGQCILLEGIPEDALASYIHQYSIDILMIGLVSRNKLEKLWVGSTTTALLNDPPCDMLLIKH